MPPCESNTHSVGGNACMCPTGTHFFDGRGVRRLVDLRFDLYRFGATCPIEMLRTLLASDAQQRVPAPEESS